MNKIDEQPDKEIHSPGEVLKTSSQVASSAAHSRPFASEAAAVLSMDLYSEQDMSLQVVASKTTSRRAWLRRGVAVASPVVASLVSAPVYGAGCLTLTPSSFASATFASHHPGVTFCAFLGPNSWFNNLGAWPAGTTTGSGIATTAVKFKDAFLVNPGVESGITGNTTLNEVLGGTFSNLAKYSIAAYLNAKKGTLNFPLTADQAIAVYKSYKPVVVAVKPPPLVATWTQTDTETWLQKLMP